MAVADLTFQIGNVRFTDPFEMPNGIEEGLGDLGSMQHMTVTEFPGGIVSAQLYGRFKKPIEWKGKIFGADAHDRARQLDDLTSQGLIKLQYGQWDIDGLLKNFIIKAKYQFEVHYEAIFIPIQDDSLMGQSGLASLPNSQGTLSQAQQVAQNQSQNPTSPYSFSPSIQQGVAQLNSTINKTLQNYSGNLQAFQTPDIKNIQSQIDGLKTQLAPLINGSDPYAASAASDLNTSLDTISVALKSTPGIIAQIPVVNPNLYTLASIYYGDPSQWELIKNANGLNDPYPVGSFNLIIPQSPGVTTPPPLTIV